MIWYIQKEKPLPRDEKSVIIKHTYGVDYINFNQGAFRFCYSGTEVPPAIMENIIFWGDPAE